MQRCELATHLPVGGQRLKVNRSRFHIKGEPYDAVRQIKAIISGLVEENVIELDSHFGSNRPRVGIFIVTHPMRDSEKSGSAYIDGWLLCGWKENKTRRAFMVGEN